MSETVKTSFSLEQITVERIEALATETHRGKGDVVDWAVEEIWNRNKKVETPSELVNETATA